MREKDDSRNRSFNKTRFYLFLKKEKITFSEKQDLWNWRKRGKAEGAKERKK